MKECPVCKRCFPDEINHCPQDGDVTIPSLHGEPVLDARYQLEKRLGQGGMGVVFQARHIFLKTAHAIKVILPDLVGNDPMLVTRFRQEALAAAAIRHQNIIAVTDFGVARGTMPFLVMEFVNGRSLQEILAEEKVMAPDRALEIISALASGVAAAHRQNIVHRDLKPLNIMAQNGVPMSEGLKILDFGLAKIKSGDLLGSFVQAKTSGLMGSPFYMAPEQWSDDEPDARADIYSLGIILYQMLAGDVPFKGSSIPSIMKKHLTLSPPSFRSFGLDIPPQIEAVVRHALEKEPNARTPSIEAFLQELREAVSASPSSAIPGVARPTGGLDPNRTVISALSSHTNPAIGEVSQPDLNSLAGTVSSASVRADVQQEVAETYRREQEQKERAAREELEREAEARRRAQEQELRKRQEEEERERKAREEREARERQQREQIERVERQARELEEKLARLATSMPPPQVGVIDPEATQVRAAVQTQPGADNSFPGGQLAYQQSAPAISLPTGARKAAPLLIVAVVLISLLVIGGIVSVYLLTRQSSTTASDNPPPKVTDTPGRTSTVKTDLIEIPGGTFQMGRNDGPPQERPQHEVTVQTFFMDRTEVTNEEYEGFVRDMRVEPPAHWVRGKPLPLQEKWPVVNVSPKDAEAFAAWRSKRDGVTYRLPTEEEWEYAARSGGEYRLYPWGDRWEDRKSVVKEADAKPVGSFPEGANRWGVVDLIGNVWEWTSTKASLYPGNTREIPAATRDWVVARGGSYSSDPRDRVIPISATYRDWYEDEFRQPNYGFRLVKSAQ
jgi:serine/threonine protein kinase/formylglycine-generating enzyme required for sulfatase activity